MGRSKRHAFTLAELVVVIAVIGLLAAIVLPFFTKAFTAQRRVACASHLEKIGQACATRIASLGAGVGRGLPALGWQNALRSFVSDDKTVFLCPEDPDPAPDPGAGLKGVCIECFHGGNFVWDVYLDQADSDQWIWKMSGTQYKAFMKVAGEGVTTSYKGVYTKTGYVEDEDPYTVYYTFEDTAPWGGGDQDFYDVILEAHTTATQIQFTVTVRASGMSFNLCKKDPDRKVLIPNPRVGNKATLPFYGGESSYGINSMSAEIVSGTRKLLALDYERTVAVGSTYDDEGTDRAQHLSFWDPDPETPKAPPVFARHFEKCNVLFADGAVRLMDLDTINPNDPENAREYWDPK
jgi:prepilin-type N-terminal cleavage/methylation domain-containing protein/prepilin-type processing-associated H-X9-DG protein